MRIKIFYLVFLLTIAQLLFSCKSSSSTPPPAPVPPNNTTSATPATPVSDTTLTTPIQNISTANTAATTTATARSPRLLLNKPASLLLPAEAQKLVESRAKEILIALKNNNLNELSKYVHPNKGLRFSNSAHIDTIEDQKFSASALLSIADPKRIYTWGYSDGSGEAIEMEYNEFYKKYLFNKDYTKATQVTFNKPIGKGNTVNNQKSAYKNAVIVEYHIEGTKKFDGMDWGSIYLILEPFNDDWYLVGIARGAWSI